MKSMHLTVGIALLVGGWIGCADQRVERHPPLVAEKEPSRARPERNILESAGETTLNLVSAPVRLVVPEKKPVSTKEPEHWEPAEVIILAPPKAQEPATQP